MGGGNEPFSLAHNAHKLWFTLDDQNNLKGPNVNLLEEKIEEYSHDFDVDKHFLNWI